VTIQVAEPKKKRYTGLNGEGWEKPADGAKRKRNQTDFWGKMT
jgi:hypothetical protein